MEGEDASAFTRRGEANEGSAHLVALVVGNERRFGEYVAVLFEGRAYTNRELSRQAGRLAAALRDLGIRRGDRVLVHLPNLPETWVSFLACWLMGGVVVPTLPQLAVPEVAYCAEDAEAVVAITDEAGAAKVLEVRERASSIREVVVTGGPVRGTLSFSALVGGTVRELREEPSEEDLAALVYTSGTTGRPKGVMLTHRNFWSMARSCVMLYSPPGEDPREFTALVALPLSHIFGLGEVVATMAQGNRVVLMRRFEAGGALELIREHRVRLVPAVPTMVIRMMEVEDARDSCRSVMQWDVGGAPTPVGLIDEIEERLGGTFTEGWGLTETTMLGASERVWEPTKRGSVGRPVPGMALRVVGADGRVRGPGELGEFEVRGDMVMRGYWRRPQATERAFHDGWLRTGDVGYVDEDGYAFIVDRKDDLILRGGEKVSPREVEEVLYRHPAVREAAVVGVADAVYGERVAAYVALRGEAEADVEAIRAFCAERLARFKVPDLVHVLAELPRSGVGKIRRVELRRMAEARPFAGGETGF